MKFADLMAEVAHSNDPESQQVTKHMQSPQFQLSLKILGLRIKKGYTEEQAAELTHLSVSDYESFENGIMQANEAKYQQVYNALNTSALFTFSNTGSYKASSDNDGYSNDLWAPLGHFKVVAQYDAVCN